VIFKVIVNDTTIIGHEGYMQARTYVHRS
jgi:hypothetical protein